MENYKASQFNIIVEKDEMNSILYNCYSGGIIKIENEFLQCIEKSLISKLDNKIITQLFNNGFIVSKNIDEYRRVKNEFQMNLNTKQNMVTYVIAPTLRCNLNCEYCFQKNYRDNKCQDISNETLDNIIEFIIKSNKNNPNLKYIKISWFGGEPLLCYDKIIKFSKIIKQKLKDIDVKLMSGIVTNGVLLDEQKLLSLIDEANLMHLQITVDGEVDTYCLKKQTTPEIYERVINNIILSTKFIKTVVRLNSDKTNYKELTRLSEKLYSKVKNKDNLKIHFAQLRNYNNTQEMINEYFDDYEYAIKKKEFYTNQVIKGNLSDNVNKNTLSHYNGKFFCGLAPYMNMVIDEKGNLFKCEHHLGNLSKVVGDVINGVYHNSEYNQFLNPIYDSRCEKCNIYPCCNYSQCVIMHNFCGEGECKVHEQQLKSLIYKVKCYIGENINGNGKSSDKS